MMLHSLDLSQWLFFPINAGIMMSTRFAIYKILSVKTSIKDTNNLAMMGALPLF
jgi:hypothetical protein